MQIVQKLCILHEEKEKSEKNENEYDEGLDHEEHLKSWHSSHPTSKDNICAKLLLFGIFLAGLFLNSMKLFSLLPNNVSGFKNTKKGDFLNGFQTPCIIAHKIRYQNNFL